MLQRVALRVTGKVQGVFFRSTVKNYAQQSGFGGFAKNEYDGSVSIVAVGDQAVLERFVEWVRSSPGAAQVEAVTVQWETASAVQNNFRIL